MSISLNSQRVLHGLTDISIAVGDFRSGAYALTYTAGQYIYIGANSPFSNLYLEMATPLTSMTSPGAPTIEVRWGNAWSSVVDVLDQTAGLTANGRISWSVDALKGWEWEQYSKDVGLTGTHIYNRFWLRISWAANFSASLKYLGQKFSDDTTFRSYYPDLMQAEILDGYETGKTNWNEQHYMAAEMILADLEDRNIIKKAGQVFDWSKFEITSCHKVASIIFNAMGRAYADSKTAADHAYNKEIGLKLKNIDTNEDGRLTPDENVESQNWMTR
jgi:hypothetical protein